MLVAKFQPEGIKFKKKSYTRSSETVFERKITFKILQCYIFIDI
jgi:hypothetical protein